MAALEKALRARKDAGQASFVPYVTGGFPGVDADLLRGLQEAGADALEVGLPFSDPVMDGSVVQEASRRALEAGTTPSDVLNLVAEAALSIPVAVMTYVNPVLRIGSEVFFERAGRAGVAGVIVPDVPVDEIDPFRTAADACDIDTVLLAAPGSTPERLAQIGDKASGFVYCVATYGVTGARASLSNTAEELVAALRPLTDLPLLVGVGISTPEHAEQAALFADGVIVGSAMMAPILEGDRDGAVELAAGFRRALG